MVSLMKKRIRVVCAIIFKEDESVCITQRNDSLLSGLWEFPGGKVEIGEDDNEALVREIQEELEVSIEVKNHYHTTTYEYPECIVTLVSFVVKTEHIVTHSHVHKQVLYVPIGDLCGYSFAPADIEIVNKLCQKVTT